MTPPTTQVVLLRGINVGSANRIAMADLRAALDGAGFSGARTHLASGNVVVAGDPVAIVAAIRTVIDVPCLTRSIEELDASIAANPFAAEADADPRRLQVSFRDEPITHEEAEALVTCATASERIAVARTATEIYSWHPEGIAGSKLARALTPPGQRASARNWSTVRALSQLAHA